MPELDLFGEGAQPTALAILRAGVLRGTPALPGATTLVKFRRLLGEEGVEELLDQTITLAVSLKLIPAAALARANPQDP